MELHSLHELISLCCSKDFTSKEIATAYVVVNTVLFSESDTRMKSKEIFKA